MYKFSDFFFVWENVTPGEFFFAQIFEFLFENDLLMKLIFYEKQNFGVEVSVLKHINGWPRNQEL